MYPQAPAIALNSTSPASSGNITYERICNLLNMESATHTLDAAKQSLREEGFVEFEEPSLGASVLEMEERKFPYFTEYGLDFCAKFAFDPRILFVLENTLGSCTLGHWLRYGEFPGHIQCFRKGGPEAGRHVMMVHLWAEGSQVDYYAGSHLVKLETFVGQRGLYEAHPSTLAMPQTKEFKDGGLVIADARLFFEIKRGYAIIFIFATNEVVKGWRPIASLHHQLAGKVADIRRKSKMVDLNFDFKGYAGFAHG